MSRIELIKTRESADEARVEAFDRIVASRGSMPLPFAALLHAPGVADATANLGSALKAGTLSPRMRELVIATTAHERGCEFEWEVHSAMALEAGVPVHTIDAVRASDEVPPGEDRVVIDMVRAACRSGSVDEGLFRRAVDLLGTPGVVELVSLIGYYSSIALVISMLELD